VIVQLAEPVAKGVIDGRVAPTDEAMDRAIQNAAGVFEISP
jgi:hypothetical protein